MIEHNKFDDYADTVEEYSGPATASFWGKWFWGVLVSAAVVAYGLSCCISGEAWLPGRGSHSMNLKGTQGIVMSFAWMSAGLFLHFHYFWSLSPRLCAYADIGKLVSLIAGVGTLGYVVYSVVIKF